MDDQYTSDPHHREAVVALAAEFSGRLPRTVVVRTVRDARRDLQGQIVPEALDEMLHHLAHHRLSSLTARVPV